MGLPPSPTLSQLVDETRRVTGISKDDDLGRAIVEMDDLLAEAGVLLDEDLDVEEYIQTLQHVDDILDGKVQEGLFGLVGKVAGHVAKKLKPGFKMVFGRLVKAGKKAYHKQRAGSLQHKAAKASALAAQHRKLAGMHAPKAKAKRKPPARRPKAAQAPAAARTRRKAMSKKKGTAPASKNTGADHAPGATTHAS